MGMRAILSLKKIPAATVKLLKKAKHQPLRLLLEKREAKQFQPFCLLSRAREIRLKSREHGGLSR